MKVSDARAALPQNCSLHKVNAWSSSENGTSVPYVFHHRAMPNGLSNKGLAALWKTWSKRYALAQISTLGRSFVMSGCGNWRHKRWSRNRGRGRNRYLTQVKCDRYASLPKSGP
jgi:hypothetical protein